ncbi:germination protein YpeB [Microaerobacter geothermalis]|uniref:germination protein YpeB n=1 Tax=Microaerobacter geothermalis TaxID=674972 RepID=UPI001F3E32A3|nr:germination protein YpeB [Microaerobacter geothermalis]MCF6093517.1 germination protein YpeB [Microaerobacter geothermalis]
MMYKWISGILLPVLLVALVAVGFWGYQENQEKNSILIKAENQYQRAFHDLNYHMDKLTDEIGRTLAVNSRKMTTECLTNIWRLAYAAQSDVGQLPLTLMPFNKTEEFLAKIADFSYQTALRDLEKRPLSQEEKATLSTLYSSAKKIRKELNGVQTKVIDKQLRWMDVETALATEDKQMDNTIIDGFKTVDKQVQEYHDIDWGATVSNLETRKKERIKNIKGKEITAEQAKEKAYSYLGLPKGSVLKVSENKEGLEYKSYSISLDNPKSKQDIKMDVTKTGGHVIWFLNNRDVAQPKIDLEQARVKADQFLKRHGYPPMESIKMNQYDNLGLFTFVYKQGNVFVYPDAITVKVALDKGEVIGLNAEEYLLSHTKREIPRPALSENEARSKVNGNVKVQESRLVLIESDGGKEVLTYEFLTTLNDETYRIYINALTGEEEEVEKLKEEEAI